jgi:hypothetical protein
MKRWMSVAIVLGLYLTLRGYHSRDGDQAYRLPLLLHAQDASLYANDPFVSALDEFNPHRGYLAVLDGLSRVTGLSVAIFAMFAATFAVTCLALDRLARAAWPGSGPRVGLVAVGLVLVAKAGNLGTNHLFEAMLLDRLVALALGWTAIGALVADPPKGRWTAALCVGLMAVIHPSIGLQIGMLLVVGLLAWAIVERGSASSWRAAAAGGALIVAALAPAMVFAARGGSRLMEGLPPDDFLTLSASIQSPQHMLPHLWRLPQWLAGACYLVVAALAVRGGPPSRERTRLVVLTVLIVIGLALATIAIEVVGSVRATLFQPFRMATVARGLCLVLMADRVRQLWGRGDVVGQSRAAILVAGLSGDWAFVAATIVELAATAGERFGRRAEAVLAAIALAFGGLYLSRHDTESGHLVLLATFLAVIAAHLVSTIATGRLSTSPLEGEGRSFRGGVRGFCLDVRSGRALAPSPLTRRLKPLPSPSRGEGGNQVRAVTTRTRFVVLASLAWLIPASAMIVPNLASGHLANRLAAHCRFGEWPVDDVERLAAWCRANTPTDARFIGPPGPKTFRLWSRRELAFNRAASPYHAAGLADWASRFRDHVGFSGSITEFAAMYLKDRQALDRGFDRMDAGRLSALACREGADHVLASSKLSDDGSLERLKVEGRYAVYRVKSSPVEAVARRSEVSAKSR